MTEKKGIFKSFNPFYAMLIAMISGLGSLYFGTKLVPIFLEVTELINRGTPLNGTGLVVIGLLSLYGTFTYLLALIFQLSQKRVVEAFYC